MSESRISDKQLHANRENAKKSTGPKTTTGKNTSRLNGTRHGYTGQVLIQTDDDFAAYRDFSKKMFADLAPVGAIETDLAQSIIDIAWRRNRIQAGETNYLALRLGTDGRTIETDYAPVHTAFVQAEILVHNAKNFCNVALYEQRLTSMYLRNMKTYREMQSNRPNKRAAEKPKTMTAGHSTPKESIPYGQNGFGFSNQKTPAQREAKSARPILKSAS